MDDGKRHIYGNGIVFSEFFHGIGHHGYLAVFIDKYDSLGFFQQFGDIFVRLNVPCLLPCVHVAVFGDVYRDDLIFFLIHAHYGLDSRDNGNLMLHALSAKQHCYLCLHSLKSPLNIQ